MRWLLEARNSNFQNEQGKNQAKTNPGFEITLRMRTTMLPKHWLLWTAVLSLL